MKVNNPHNYMEPTSDMLREIALDIKEILPDIEHLSPTCEKHDKLKAAVVILYELAHELEGVVSCDICGDSHDIDSIPLSCESGDGE
jgi:hypothetical protein